MCLSWRGFVCLIVVVETVLAANFDTGELKFILSEDTREYGQVANGCLKIGAEELQISSDAEFNAVRLQIATNQIFHDAQIWVNVTSVISVATGAVKYTWASGNSLSSANFVTHFGEPDGSGTGCDERSRLCVAMTMTYDRVNLGAYQLYDLCCTDSLHYMCSFVERLVVDVSDGSAPSSTSPPSRLSLHTSSPSPPASSPSSSKRWTDVPELESVDSSKLSSISPSAQLSLDASSPSSSSDSSSSPTISPTPSSASSSKTLTDGPGLENVDSSQTSSILPSPQISEVSLDISSTPTSSDTYPSPSPSSSPPSPIPETTIPPSIREFWSDGPYLEVVSSNEASFSLKCQITISNWVLGYVIGYNWFLDGNFYTEQNNGGQESYITINHNGSHWDGLFTCSAEFNIYSEANAVHTYQSESVRVSFSVTFSISTTTTVIECFQPISLTCFTSNVIVLGGYKWKRSGGKMIDTLINVLTIISFGGGNVGYYACAGVYTDGKVSLYSDEVLLTLKTVQTSLTWVLNRTLGDTNNASVFEITCMHSSCGKVRAYHFMKIDGEDSEVHTSLESTWILVVPENETKSSFNVRCALEWNDILSDWSENVTIEGRSERQSTPTLELSLSEQSTAVLDPATSSVSLSKASSSIEPSLSAQSRPTTVLDLETSSVSLSRSSSSIEPSLSEHSATVRDMETPSVSLSRSSSSIEPSLSEHSATMLDEDASSVSLAVSTVPSLPFSSPHTVSTTTDEADLSSSIRSPSSVESNSLTSTIPTWSVDNVSSALLSDSSLLSDSITSTPATFTVEASRATTIMPSVQVLQPVVIATNLTVEEDAAVSLLCSTEELGNGEDVKYTWGFNNSPLWSHNNSILHVENFTDANVGEYICMVTYREGDVTRVRVSNTLVLALLGSRTSQSDFYSHKPSLVSNVTTPETGSCVTLECLWELPEAVSNYFILSGVTMVYKSDEVNVYSIEEFSAANTGEYRCAVDVNGQISALSNVLVMEMLPSPIVTTHTPFDLNKPVLKSSYTVMYIGYTLKFTCISPRRDIDEYVIFKTGATPAVVHRGPDYISIVESVGLSHNGDYACQFIAGGNTSDSSDVISVEVIPADKVCNCHCPSRVMSLSVNTTDVGALTSSITKELSVNVDELSATISKFISSPDERQSSAGIGTIAVGLLCLVFGLIIASDFIYVYQGIARVLQARKEALLGARSSQSP